MEKGFDVDEQLLLANLVAEKRQKRTSNLRTLTVALSLAAVWAYLRVFSAHGTRKVNHIDAAKVQQCSIDNFKSDLSFLDNAVPIEAEEFIERRDYLAKALAVNGVDAFVVEPGYTFQ